MIYYELLYIDYKKERSIPMDLILTDHPLLSLPSGSDLRLVNVAEQAIAPCVGCFGCWVKTPGRCVIRDDAPAIYPDIAHCDRLLVVSRLFLGCYDVPMKRLMERSLPSQQAFIRLHHGESHHFQRAVKPKELTVVAYGAQDEEERAIFDRWLARNSLNTLAEHYTIHFADSEAQVEALAGKVVQAWAN